MDHGVRGLRRNVQFVFHTDESGQRSGFIIKYRIGTCVGAVTARVYCLCAAPLLSDVTNAPSTPTYDDTKRGSSFVQVVGGLFIVALVPDALVTMCCHIVVTPVPDFVNHALFTSIVTTPSSTCRHRVGCVLSPYGRGAIRATIEHVQ